jgi:hypothetical protein
MLILTAANLENFQDARREVLRRLRRLRHDLKISNWSAG